MIACFDVHYKTHFARAAAILFQHWQSDAIFEHHTIEIEGTSDYQPGQFYQRELAPLSALIKTLKTPITHYVIDAYCHVTSDRAPGLGAYLYETLPAAAIMIGVAKNRFKDTTHAIELFRGTSRKPLFVTSIGIRYEAAAALIESMSGPHRNPTLLKSVDRLCRDGALTHR